MGFPTSKFAVLLLALGIVMGPVIRTAHAGVAVAPLKQEISLKPGEATDVSLTLSYNNRLPTDGPQKVILALSDVQVSEEGALAFKDAGTLGNSAAKWATLDAGDVTLEPGASGKIACRLVVPETAAPGEYYLAVMVTLANKGITDKGVSVQYRIASGIFVTVLGRTFAKEARIARCELAWPQSQDAATRPANEPGAESAAPAPIVPAIKVLLANTGKARFDATGKLTVLDDQSRIVFVSPLASKRPTVFGGDSRLFDAAITRALTPGKYTFRVEMDYQSAWAKARQDMRVEILPEQAALLAQMKQHQHVGAALMEATPDSLASTVPPGATRSLAITVKNTSDGELTCTAGVAASAGAGATLLVRPEQFTLAKGAKKTVEVRVESVGDGTLAGHLSAMVNIDAAQEGAGHTNLLIPVDIQQKTER